MAKATGPITAAVIGLGRSGWDIHVAQMRNRPDFKIVAVADPLKDRQEQAKKELGCQAFDSIGDLLKNSDAELVVVATRSADHMADSIASFKAGKHVLCEKPVAMNAAEVKKIMDAAKKAKKLYFPHQNYRFNSISRHLHQLLEGKSEIGPIFDLKLNSTGFRRRNDWQTLAKNGGGMLFNQCTHMLDMVMSAANSPVTDVYCHAKQTTDSGDVEDHVKIVLQTKKGIQIDISYSTSMNVELPSYIICGEYGTAWSDGKTTHMRYFDPKKFPKLPVVDGAAANRKYGNEEKLEWIEKSMPSEGPSIGSLYDNVHDVLRNG
ncbi:MAG TPA: Gfo/Idh/MocA family oxidoreductase, partial [Planctomycetota bacterium]|nr:Gfo/Idh/MocA family oxidoreductase [Planctomycetota bacterium]